MTDETRKRQPASSCQDLAIERFKAGNPGQPKDGLALLGVRPADRARAGDPVHSPL